MKNQEKKLLRNKILLIRDSLEEEVKNNMDYEIYKKLIDSELYLNANNIFIYMSFGKEIETKNIINKALKDKKKVYIPKIYKEDKSMRAIRLKSLAELKENSMGILEPIDDSDYINKEQLDLILVPGVVFDLSGHRIGYGGGYYDRYLEDIKAIRNKLVLAYDLQVIDFIDSEIHDIKFDYIITNTRFSEIYK